MSDPEVYEVVEHMINSFNDGEIPSELGWLKSEMELLGWNFNLADYPRSDEVYEAAKAELEKAGWK